MLQVLFLSPLLQLPVPAAVAAASVETEQSLAERLFSLQQQPSLFLHQPFSIVYKTHYLCLYFHIYDIQIPTSLTSSQHFNLLYFFYNQHKHKAMQAIVYKLQDLFCI